MTRTLMGDVGNGKGSKRRLGSDQDKYNEGWQRIFGKKDSEPERNELKHEGNENDDQSLQADQR